MSSRVFKFEGDDPEMVKSWERARKTFRFFWRELTWEYRRIVPGLSIASVKVAFSDPPETRQEDDDFETEHMWIDDILFDGKRITGTLLNTPNNLRSVQEGDQISVTGSQISDWMYVLGDSVFGGFTIDVLRSQMNSRERKEHDAAWGLDFGPVGIVDLVPNDFLGEKSEKSGWFSSTPKKKQQSFQQVLDVEHPMSINMRESLAEAIAANPEVVSETDEKGFNYLHQLALAGSLDGVDVCLSHGADPNTKTHSGMTPFSLAKCLGWKKVMQRIHDAGGR